ncbi:M23 family metallopeptidase [Paraburkholderia fungorum]|uniref:M23 family metallopeptidase n=1 Tax=Paraburkholderia fungorum TaxID=134537 RepID=UPI002092F0FD|nr:M23 family metallopeptidase [Paraburkholderia fungorum]USU18835.1 M23 family metallopeptidase [Paraburkholderia fungorum]USU29169.1 M23 family metallopeptidase [Paraburkholderia fungorum]
MSGKIFPVDAQGTYLTTNQDSPHQPTTIPLQTLGLSPGDYIALQEQGAFIPGQGLAPSNNLCSCFFAGRRAMLPADLNQQKDVVTLPSYYGNVPTDIPEDFSVPVNGKVMVRAPTSATEIAFTPNDSFFADNQSGDFRVLVSAPNKPHPSFEKFNAIGSASTTTDWLCYREQDEIELFDTLDSLAPSPFPVATTFLGSPFAHNGDTACDPQWRGWYKSRGWSPKNSGYNPKGLGGYRKHGGWDIFAPCGTQLVAAVGPAIFSWLPGISGLGNVAVLRFSYEGKTYTLVYAHASASVGAPRKVQAGEVIALSGCSGNAAQEDCGKELPSGGFTDHVHVGLYPRTAIKPAFAIDPSTLLTWNVVTPG